MQGIVKLALTDYRTYCHAGRFPHKLSPFSLDDVKAGPTGFIDSQIELERKPDVPPEAGETARMIVNPGRFVSKRRG